MVEALKDHERIWLQNAEDGKRSGEGRMWCADKIWPDHPEDGEPTEYVRADLHAALEAEVERLREALTPSADTKAAYMGEFSFGVTLCAGNQEDYRRIEVPWTTIKEIMAAIRARAALARRASS